jgi:hypothetical protein
MITLVHEVAAHFAGVSAPTLNALPRPNVNKEVGNALAIVFSIVGAISLLIVVVAGFTLITSQGDPQKVAQARNAIVYAAAGLAVSILAVSIVGFAIGHL